MMPDFIDEAQRPTALEGYSIIIRLPVQWSDQDAFGHVNNTVPIRWFESSRIAYLERSGMGQMMQQGGLGPILASVTCHFRRQIKYPDVVFIASRTARVGRSSMSMEHVVYSQQQNAVVAEGTAVVVVFDYEAQRPVRVPEDVRRAILSTDKNLVAEG